MKKITKVMMLSALVMGVIAFQEPLFSGNIMGSLHKKGGAAPASGDEIRSANDNIGKALNIKLTGDVQSKWGGQIMALKLTSNQLKRAVKMIQDKAAAHQSDVDYPNSVFKQVANIY